MGAKGVKKALWVEILSIPTKKLVMDEIYSGFVF